MSILFFIQHLFAAPTFHAGERVNLVRGGSLQRSDGCVVAQTERGVLVEWPRGGASVVPATDLCAIG